MKSNWHKLTWSNFHVSATVDGRNSKMQELYLFRLRQGETKHVESHILSVTCLTSVAEFTTWLCARILWCESRQNSIANNECIHPKVLCFLLSHAVTQYPLTRKVSCFEHHASNQRSNEFTISSIQCPQIIHPKKYAQLSICTYTNVSGSLKHSG